MGKYIPKISGKNLRNQMPKMKSRGGWGKRHYVYKWYGGLFNKSGKDRKIAAKRCSQEVMELKI